MQPTWSRTLRCGVVLLLACAWATWATSAAGQAPEEKTGLKVGEKAPGFKLKDQAGRERSRDELLGKGKVVLVFHRSASW